MNVRVKRFLLLSAGTLLFVLASPVDPLVGPIGLYGLFAASAVSLRLLRELRQDFERSGLRLPVSHINLMVVPSVFLALGLAAMIWYAAGDPGGTGNFLIIGIPVTLTANVLALMVLRSRGALLRAYGIPRR